MRVRSGRWPARVRAEEGVEAEEGDEGAAPRLALAVGARPLRAGLEAVEGPNPRIVGRARHH